MLSVSAVFGRTAEERREEPGQEKSSTLVMKSKHAFSRIQPSSTVSVKLTTESCNVEGVYGCENCFAFS